MSSIKAPQVYRTRSGLPVQLRPATPFDGRALRQFLAQLSEQDRAALAPLVENGDAGHSASFLAFEMDAGALVGVARLERDETGDCGRVTVRVRPDFQGRGLGWLLLDVLVREAGLSGVRQVVALQDRGDVAAIALECEQGFEIVADNDDPAQVVLSRPIA